MPQAPGLLDRLRIERAVWTFDTYAGDLPGKRRREIRRELRADLWASAQEVGGAEAIRGLGGLRRLAAGYIVAEYGEEGPRPRWVKGVFWVFLVEYLLLTILFARLGAFDAGLETAGPDTGSYRFLPLGRWGPVYDVRYDDGRFAESVLEFTPALLPFAVVMVATFVIGGRMWRAVPALRRRVHA